MYIFYPISPRIYMTVSFFFFFGINMTVSLETFRGPIEKKHFLNRVRELQLQLRFFIATFSFVLNGIASLLKSWFNCPCIFKHFYQSVHHKFVRTYTISTTSSPQKCMWDWSLIETSFNLCKAQCFVELDIKLTCSQTSPTHPV